MDIDSESYCQSLHELADKVASAMRQGREFLDAFEREYRRSRIHNAEFEKMTRIAVGNILRARKKENSPKENKKTAPPRAAVQQSLFAHSPLQRPRLEQYPD